jgi:hypothetical protein
MPSYEVIYHQYTPISNGRQARPERKITYTEGLPFGVEGGAPAPGTSIRRMLTNSGGFAAHRGGRAVTITCLA